MKIPVYTKLALLVILSAAFVYAVAEQAPQDDAVAPAQPVAATAGPTTSRATGKLTTGDTPWDDPAIASRTPEEQWVMYEILHPKEANAAKATAFPPTTTETAARNAAIQAITQPQAYNAAVNAQKTSGQLQDEERVRQSILNPGSFQRAQ